MENTRRKLLAGGCGTLAFTGVTALIVAALVLPSQIRSRAEATVADLETQLGIDIEVGALEASLFAHFPRASVTMSDLSLVNRAPFEGVQLFEASELTVAVDVMSLFSDTLQVRMVSVVDGSIDLRSGADGGNWELGSKSASGPSTLGVELDDIRLDDVDLRWSNADGTFAGLTGIHHRSHGSVQSERMMFATDTTSRLSAGTASTTYLRDVALVAKGPVGFQNADGQLAFDGFSVALGELGIVLNGTAVPAGDGWDTKMDLEAPSATFKSLLTLLPAGTLADGLKTEGVFVLRGNLEGHYEGDVLPSGALDITVADANVSSAAGRIDGIGFESRVERKQGPWEDSKVVVSKGRFSVANSPSTLSLTALPPLTDPFVDLTAKGRLDLKSIDRILGLGLKMDGTLDADVAVKAKASSLSPESPGDAKGHIRGKGIRIPLRGFPDPLTVSDLDLGLSANSVDVNTLTMRTGPTDLAVTGKLERALGWALGLNPLGGRLQVTGDTVDLRTLASEKTEDAVIVAVPTDLALSVELALGQVYQGDYHLRNVRGETRVKGGTLTLAPLGFSTLGGTVRMEGDYRAPTAEVADLDMQVGFDGLAMDQVMKTMDTAADAIPAASRAGGTVGGQVELKTRLKPDTSPDLNTLFSKGLVLTFGSTAAPSVLQELSAKLGDPKLASLKLDKARFDYVVKEGRLTFEPVALKLGTVPASLKGSAGVIDQTVDLGLAFKAPTKSLAATGLKIPSSAANVDVTATIKGPYSKPKLGVQVAGLDDLVNTVRDEVVDRVKTEANKWIAEAERQGDKLIAEAEKASIAARSAASKAAEAVRKEARKEANRLEQGASNPVARVAAKKAGDLLVAEAEKSAKKLEREGDKQADALVAEAKKQKTKLVADARARTD